jgi:hypothetical protein
LARSIAHYLRLSEPEQQPEHRLTDYEVSVLRSLASVDIEQRIQQAVAAERAYMLEVLAEIVAEMRNRFIDEIEQA